MTEEVKTETAEAPVQLSLQDLATAVQIIDICSRRGAFEGPELEAVGGLRSRIVKFVNAATPKDQEQPEGIVPEVERPVEETTEEPTAE